MSATARPALAGLARTGAADFSDGDRQRKHAAERGGVDRHGDRRGALAGDLLRDQAAERVPDDGRLDGEAGDRGQVVVGDGPDLLVGEDLGVLTCLGDGCRVIGPARSDGGVPGLFEEPAPPVPAAGEQPEPVHEDDGRLPGRVRGRDLGLLGAGQRGGGVSGMAASRSWGPRA